MTDEIPTFKQAMLAALPSLRAFALSLSGRADRADDLVQEAVMKAWAKQNDFKLGTNMQAWLVTILRNTYYSQMRKRGREVQDSEGTFTARLSVAPAHDGVMDMADFRRALASLPDDQREALLLVGASGFSYEQAAGICGCAVGTIKSRVSRARSRLQDVLKISGPSDFGPDRVSAGAVARAFVE
ncbi:MAG: RNA polymerase subunit sigma [Rhodovulum sulfidophilum]|uniref:RNA polymerase sigma factor n=1 Tax=Rhodovulum sulfidophilum TaxID=35806 RepID=A0A2W5NP25_RHOSU|nr:MAG: RNA polymerase subunit sigma [Rhodovulum sulfidophilum]